VSKFITDEYQDEVGRVLQLALQGEETANYEFPLFTRTGERREILLNATPRLGADGEIIGVIGVGQDITQLRKVTAERQLVADDLSRLIETANAPIFGVDVRGDVTDWNRKAIELSGFSKEEAMGKSLIDEFITEESRAEVAAVLRRAGEGEDTDDFEFRLLTKSGKSIIILLNATTRRDANGRVTGMVGVGQDITNLRKAMYETAHVADDLTRMIDTANAPIFGIDRQGRVTEWNRRAAAISGWTTDETLGEPLLQKFISEQYRESVSRVLAMALDGKEAMNYEFPLFTKDGRRREILLNATPRRGSDGEIIGVIGVGQDITELRQATAEQQRIADDLSRLIETANAPIFGVNVEGFVIEWNRKAAELSGYAKAETMERSW
jgi:PAS domain S-box-containing protein